MSEHIIIKDPLYKQIFVSTRHKKYLDSPAFQRLRYIKQTSFVDMVYPSANHTRFSHSLGAYHLMNKVINNGLMDIDSKAKNNLLLSAMLHDIGHGPFSHLWEKVFPHFDHEKTTQQILREWKLDDVADILQKKSPYSYLISSTIDVDKLDYMARDSYFAGVSYGVAEVDFIIQHSYIENGKFIIKPSALSSVEDLITQRVNLFKTVYFHKFAIELDFLFISIFERVKDLLAQNRDVHMNEALKSFFNKTNTTKDLLALNDHIILFHIHQWSTHSDSILKDLCERLIYRKKFETINLTYNKVNVEAVRKKVAHHYDPKYYFTDISIPITIVQTPIYVQFSKQLKKLEDASELIKFYKTQNWKVEILVFPKEIEFTVK